MGMMLPFRHTNATLERAAAVPVEKVKCFFVVNAKSKKMECFSRFLVIFSRIFMIVISEIRKGENWSR